MKTAKFEIDNEESLKLKEFLELLDWLDKNKDGQNLRMYPDGSSYIIDDNGNDRESFESIFDLVRYLRDLKSRYESGELKPVVWS